MTNRMSDFAPIERAALEIDAPDIGTLEGRAALALKGLAIANVAGVVLALFPGAIPVSTMLTVTFNAAAAALAILQVIEARGLDRYRPWAVAAVRPVLLLVAIYGTYTVIVAFGEGKIRIPFEVALVVWAWLGTADVKPVPRLELRSVALVGGAAALVGVMLFGHQLVGWGSLLDVDPPDLGASIDVDCGAAGSGPPDAITVTYDWSWARTSPLPSGVDIVVVGWTGSDAEGRPLYVIREVPDPAAGIYPGFQGYPSSAMAKEVTSESEGSFRWALELSEQRLQPARVELQLMRPREVGPGLLTLTVTGTYVHLGLWRHDTSVTCSW